MRDAPPPFLDHATSWEATCRRLASELKPHGQTWRWDALYFAASAKVPLDALERVAQTLRATLGTEWTAATVGGAPGEVRDLCAWTGGLEGEQRLFHAPIGLTTVFATLWPWTVGDAGTLRIGCWPRTDGIDERRQLGDLVRPWFGA